METRAPFAWCWLPASNAQYTEDLTCARQRKRDRALVCNPTACFIEVGINEPLLTNLEIHAAVPTGKPRVQHKMARAWSRE